MKTIGAIFLVLIALFCGGCSLFFVVMGDGKRMDFIILWGPGLAIAALCIWGLRRMYATPPASSDAENKTTPPPPGNTPPPGNW